MFKAIILFIPGYLILLFNYMLFSRMRGREMKRLSRQFGFEVGAVYFASVPGTFIQWLDHLNYYENLRGVIKVQPAQPKGPATRPKKRRKRGRR